jgi:hypothetical protein
MFASKAGTYLNEAPFRDILGYEVGNRMEYVTKMKNHINETAHFLKCKQLLVYKNLLLLSDIWC